MLLFAINGIDIKNNNFNYTLNGIKKNFFLIITIYIDIYFILNNNNNSSVTIINNLLPSKHEYSSKYVNRVIFTTKTSDSHLPND